MDKKLAHCEAMKHVRHVGWINQRVLTQITLALAALARQDVTAVSLLALDGTAAGYFEPLLGAAVCLHLWHYLLLTLPVRYLVLPVPFVPIDLHLV
jgi:hypothetical protein